MSIPLLNLIDIMDGHTNNTSQAAVWYLWKLKRIADVLGIEVTPPPAEADAEEKA